MKKIFWTLMCASALFCSCGDDDELNNDTPQNTPTNVVEKLTKENCIEFLKKDAGIDINVPSTSEIALVSQNGAFDWHVLFTSSDVEKDALTMAKSLFDQTKALSSDGVFGAIVDFESTSIYTKSDNFNSVEETKHQLMNSYQYDWFFSVPKAKFAEVQINVTEDGYDVAIEYK